MTQSKNTSWMIVAGMSVVCVMLLVSVVRADRVIGAVHNDSLTTYLGAASSVHGVRPQVWQRGKALDGSLRDFPFAYEFATGQGQDTNPDGGDDTSTPAPGSNGPVKQFCSVGGHGPGGSGGLVTQGQTAGVDLGTGGHGLLEVDIALSADVPWVIGRTYNAVQRDGSNDPMDSHGYQGVNWMQTSQPELVFYDDAGSDTDDLVYVILGAGTFLEYKRVASGVDTFAPTNGGTGAIVVNVNANDPDVAILYAPSGMRMEFFWFGDADTDDDVEGQIWRIANPSDRDPIAYVGHATDPGDAITNGYNTTTGAIEVAYDSAGRRFTYTYDGDLIGGVYHLEQVLVEINSGSWVEIARVDYFYYIDAEDHGEDGDLKLVEITTQGMDDGGDQTVAKYFRYYEGAYDDNPEGGVNLGHEHQIKMIVDFEGVRSYDWDQDSDLDDDHLSASTDDLKPYASAFFEYNADHRIVSIWNNGACGCGGGADGEYTFQYDDNTGFSDASGYDEDEWFTRTIVGQPDGTYITQYLDEVGQTLSRVVTDADPSGSPTKFWSTYVDRDANGFVEKVHSPANVSAYNHSTKSFTLEDTTGLVTLYVRNSSGDLTGMVKHIKHKKGKHVDQDEILVRSMFYETRDFDLDDGFGQQATAADVTTAWTDVAWTYDDATETEATDSSGPTGARKTAITAAHYEASDDDVLDHIVRKQSTTTRPTVDSSKNGSGSATDGDRYARDDGTTAFIESADGTFTYLEYDEGLLVKRIDDAQTNHATAFDVDPNTDFGITESGNGEHKVTTFTYDDLGRRLTVTANGRTTASYVTKLDDGRIMTLSYPKYVDTASDEFYGPISFTVANQAGRVEAQGLIELNDNSGVYTTDAQTAHVDETDSDPLLAIETVTGIGTIVRYTVNVYDDSGSQLTETRSYFSIPASGAGSEGTNYDATFFAYDDMGRRIRTKSPTGTIQRTVYDDRGRVSEQWIGTNDNGEEGGETSGTNDMVKTSANEYDGGSDEGNSLLTKATRFIDATTTDRRETHFTHDYLGRVIVQTNKDDGGNIVGPQTLNKYDNKGRLTASGLYSSGATLAITDDPTSVATNRLALSQTFYDEVGRVWKTQRHKIDPSDGSDDANLASLTWYDADGRVIKVDGEQLTKTFYDRLGRATHQFILASTDDGATTYSDADDVAGDIVLEEHQTTYDATTGEVIMTAMIERFHDDYALGETTGALDTNADSDVLKYTAANLEGRIQISASWYDDLGRVEDTVSFGTYGGSNFDRDGMNVPARSDTALRTTYTYDADGTLLEVTDPRDKKMRYLYDDLGRQVAVIANYVNGTPSGVTGDDDVYTRFAFTDGLRTKLWVDLDGDDTEDAGDQVTTYTYGTTKGGSAGDSKIGTGHLLYKVVYPEQVGSQAEADRRTLHAYNAQSQLIWMKDHEANVMEYDYDDLGRQTQQRATTLNGNFDSAVLRIATSYDSLGRRQLVTQYNNATVGSGTVVDEVKFTYDEWGNLASFDQDHNSTVATGGAYLYGIDYAYETAGSGTENGRNTIRRTQMTMPNGAYVQYNFSSVHGPHDEWVSRPTNVNVDADGSGGGSAVTVASYSYNGTGHVVRTDYPEPDVMSLAYALGSPNAYGNLDRFNRAVTSQWTADRATDHNFFDVDVFYDRASNITWVDDTVLGGWDYEYTIDGLNRLTQAERGTASGGPPPTTLSSLQFDQQWTLDQVGNWNIAKLDRNGDTDFVDTGDYNDDRSHNDVNELTARDTDDNGTDNFTLTYFKTGAMKNDGENYKYVWDAFGRLKEVLDRSDDSLVAEYTYNGLSFRTSEHHDTDTDGDVDGSDAVYHFVYDERWRIVSTYRNDDANPKEMFVHHAAGAGGYGSSSYIDAVILRDVDLSTAWNAQADALDTRHYYCQNWRADVSVIIDDSAVLVERIMYLPYGVPFGIPVGDIVTNATSAEPSEGIVGAGDYTELTTTYWGSSYNIADLDNDGDVDSADETILWNNYGAVMGWGALSDTHNRLGYAGYVFDEALAGTKWHVRHRVLESVLGRWISRDPMKYEDGPSLTAYCGLSPIAGRDQSGACSTCGGGEGWVPDDGYWCPGFVGRQVANPTTPCDDCCTQACNEAAVANPLFPPYGYAVCCGQNNTTCLCHDNMVANGLNQCTRTAMKECILRHENVHAGDIDCSVVPLGLLVHAGSPAGPWVWPQLLGVNHLPWKEPCGWACSECRAYRKSVECLSTANCNHCIGNTAAYRKCKTRLAQELNGARQLARLFCDDCFDCVDCNDCIYGHCSQ